MLLDSRLALPTIVILSLVGAGCGSQSSTKKSAPEANVRATRLEAVLNLGIPSFTGKNRAAVYYSAGFEDRAKELSVLIDEAHKFYEDRLQIKTEISVAVLNRTDWERVAPEMPFGLPSVSADPPVMLLPATPDGVVVERARALRGKAAAGTLAKIEQAGFTFEEGAEKLIDLIGLHELGHVLTLAYGIRPPSRWSNEFLASYFGYAFLREKHFKLANLFVAMTHDLDCLNGDRPEYTSLEDFDRFYLEVGPGNYGWYQGQFLGRVEKVYQSQNLAFLEEVRTRNSTSKGEDEPPNLVLERWERICPGFVEWGEKLR